MTVAFDQRDNGDYLELEPSDSPSGSVSTQRTQLDIDPAASVRVVWDSHDASSDFSKACAGAPFSAFHQSFEMGEAIKSVGGGVKRASLFAGDTLIGVAQVISHRIIGRLTVDHVMRGPVWNGSGIPNAVKSKAIDAMHQSIPAKGLHAFLVSTGDATDDGVTERGFKRVFSGYHTAYLDLTLPEETLFANLNGKWRNRLRAAQADVITILEMGRSSSRYAWLLEKDAQLMQRLRHQSSNTVLIPAFHKIAGKKSVLALEAKAGEERIAGMLFLVHGQDATYQIGWSSDRGKSMNAHNLLIWQAVTTLKKRGVRTLDLGGIDTEHHPGIARFKLGLGGTVVSLSGSWTKGPRWR
ncbi:MAG: peptidoglycan bridge formation glycyltransferase FemA/FemB family protein [Pseudomonadota bacterium]